MYTCSTAAYRVEDAETETGTYYQSLLPVIQQGPLQWMAGEHAATGNNLYLSLILEIGQ